MWLYDIPMAIGLPLFVGAIVAASCGLVILLRRWVRRAADTGGEWDRVLSYAVGAYGVFYGVTLGLIAAGAYANFTEVDATVLDESSSVAVIYRNAVLFPEPTGSRLTDEILAYTDAVIERDWPMQEQLVVPEETDDNVDTIHLLIASFEPTTVGEEILQAQTMSAFNAFVLDRRERIALTHLALPGVLWIVLGVGAFMNAVLIALIDVRNVRVHLIMAGLIASFVALLLYAITGFDHAYAGPISVTPEYFEDLRDGLFAR